MLQSWLQEMTVVIKSATRFQYNYGNLQIYTSIDEHIKEDENKLLQLQYANIKSTLERGFPGYGISYVRYVP